MSTSSDGQATFVDAAVAASTPSWTNWSDADEIRFENKQRFESIA
ncbi:MAG: hypothetical protein AAGG44_00855 [Planctomycetota bacterium]